MSDETFTTPDGLVTLDGPSHFVAVGIEALNLITIPLGQLLARPATVNYPSNWAHGWAQGLWKGSARRALVKQMRRSDGGPKPNLIRYLTIHELLGHGVDGDRMRGKRARARDMMEPHPSGWSDSDGRTGMARYWRLPSECFANRMVEALTDHRVRSPFDDDYTRTIPDAKLDRLVDLVLEDSDEPDEPTDPPIEPEPEPPPDALDAAIALAQQANADIRKDLEEMLRGLNGLAADK
jgi:hypothetical protein